MPLYEYQCRSCGKMFEMLRRMKDADPWSARIVTRTRLSVSFPPSLPGAAARPVRAALPERDSPRPVGRSIRPRVRFPATAAWFRWVQSGLVSSGSYRLPIPMPPIIIPHPMPLAWASSMCFSIWSWWSNMDCHMSIFACQRAFSSALLMEATLAFILSKAECIFSASAFMASMCSLHIACICSCRCARWPARTPGAGGVPACAPLEDCWPDGAL